MPTLLRTGLLLTTLLSLADAFAQQDIRFLEHPVRSAPGHAKDDAVLWPLDILHQRIDLNLALGSTIEGHCTITAVPRADGTDHFPLQLLSLIHISEPTRPY